MANDVSKTTLIAGGISSIDTLQALRNAIKIELSKPDPVEPAERRVYTIPTRIMRGVLTFQLERRLKSEAAAVRELLDAALVRWEASRDQA